MKKVFFANRPRNKKIYFFISIIKQDQKMKKVFFANRPEIKKFIFLISIIKQDQKMKKLFFATLPKIIKCNHKMRPKNENIIFSIIQPEK